MLKITLSLWAWRSTAGAKLEDLPQWNEMVLKGTQHHQNRKEIVNILQLKILQLLQLTGATVE